MSAWLRLHLQALADALGRLAAQPVASLLSILVLAVAMALPIVASVALRSAGTAAAGLDTDPHVNIYLALDAGDEDVKRIARALGAHRDTASVRFISRDDALAELRSSTHLAELLATLERNPLPHAFTVRVRSTAADRVAAMRNAWASLPKVDQVVADFEWSRRLAAWVRFGDRLLAGVAILLAAATAFIVSHLIRLQLLTRREEIEVSQLVGATARDVRRPFLYHGALQTGVAGLLAVALAWAAGLWAARELSALTPSYAAEMKLVFLAPGEILGLVLAAAALGVVGAWLAARREIRQFSVA